MSTLTAHLIAEGRKHHRRRARNPDLFARLVAAWKRAQKAHQWRRHYVQLEELPDHLLRDMGIHRGDIAVAKKRLAAGEF